VPITGTLDLEREARGLQLRLDFLRREGCAERIVEIVSEERMLAARDALHDLARLEWRGRADEIHHLQNGAGPGEPQALAPQHVRVRQMVEHVLAHHGIEAVLRQIESRYAPEMQRDPLRQPGRSHGFVREAEHLLRSVDTDHLRAMQLARDPDRHVRRSTA